jgi:steroid delta-isomerase-like uncharacterized protein
MDPFVRQLIDAWNSYDTSRVATLYDPEYRGHDVAQAQPQQGIEGLQSTLAAYWQAFPDLRFIAEHVIADGNQLAIFWRATGTHLGPFLNIPATGHRIEVQGAGHHILRDGRIMQSLYIWDTAGLLRALKLLPELSV